MTVHHPASVANPPSRPPFFGAESGTLIAVRIGDRLSAEKFPDFFDAGFIYC